MRWVAVLAGLLFATAAAAQPATPLYGPVGAGGAIGPSPSRTYGLLPSGASVGTITLNSVALSNNSITAGPSGSVVGTVSVATTPGGEFSGSLALSGADAASFQLVGPTLETSGVVGAGTYHITVTATQAGATGSPLAQAETITISSVPITLASVTLSNNSIAAGPTGTVVGAIGVTTSPPGLFTGSLSLSNSAGGCNGVNGADNASFQIAVANLETSGTPGAGTYQVCLLATQAGATGSPLGQAETITITSAPTITAINLSISTYPIGTTSGTTVATLTAPTSSGSFGGTFSVDDTTHFAISGSNLNAAATLSASSYNINLTATDVAFSNSPYTPPTKTLTGTGGACDNTLKFNEACNSQYLGGVL